LRGKTVLAFAGVARPEKFLRSLAEIGATVAGTRWFSDHHIFAPGEIDALARAARRLNARLVTTEKDAARMGARLVEGLDVDVLPVNLAFDRPETIVAILTQSLERARLNRAV